MWSASGSVIEITEILERHSKAKRSRAPAYSRSLQRIKGVVQRVVHGKLRDDTTRRVKKTNFFLTQLKEGIGV